MYSELKTSTISEESRLLSPTISNTVYARLLLVMALAANSTSCSVAVAESKERAFYDISLIQILADPSKHVDTSVTLFGYLAEPDFPAIYLVKEHYEAYPLAPRLIIAVGDKELEFYNSECMFQYVTISGHLIESSSGRIALSDVSMMARYKDGIQQACRPSN